MILCMTQNGEFGSRGSGHSDQGGRLSISTQIIRSISSISFCLIRFVTVRKFFPLRFASIQRAFAVLPLEDSIISLSLLFCSIPSAVLSFIDPKGLRYSSLAYISSPDIPWTHSGMRRRGVFQI